MRASRQADSVHAAAAMKSHERERREKLVRLGDPFFPASIKQLLPRTPLISNSQAQKCMLMIEVRGIQNNGHSISHSRPQQWPEFSPQGKAVEK